MPPTLLLADDSLTIQRVVSLTFADQAVRVVVAKDGQDAINRMATERPDLVLADTNMPCVDGYELARWVRQQPHLSAVPVLLLAGATDPVDEQRLQDSGANGVLEKPFEPSHVISRVKELLGLKTPPAPSSARLVTSPDTLPTRPATPVRATGAGTAEPPAAPSGTPADGPPAKQPGSGISRTAAPLADTATAAPPTPQPPIPASPPAAETAAAPTADEVLGGLGDVRDWFAAHGPGAAEPPAVPVDEGMSGPRVAGPADEPRSDAVSTPADAFESLLAAEQGTTAAQGESVTLTPELLDRLSGETRAAVTVAVEAAINEAVLGSIRSAVNDAIATALPAAVAEASARVERAVREVVAHEIREIVHETSERMVSQEIARIRGRA